MYTKIWCLIIPITIVHGLTTFSSRQGCETDQLEYRLTKLEVQVAEKAENMRGELREGNTRLQALEQQCGEMQTTLEGFQNVVVRFHTQQSQSVRLKDDGAVVEKFHHLAKGLQLVTAVLKGLSSDITGIKRNVSAIGNTTNLLFQNYDHLTTKHFLTSSLSEIKHENKVSLYKSSSNVYPRYCKEVSQNRSGVYLIQPEHSIKPFMVWCDMESRGGGWTYIHNRFEGLQDFFRNYHEYKNGFGNLGGGEFWLGLEHIHQLTGHEIHELLIELTDFNNEKTYAHYNSFSIGSELEGYSLKILDGYSGDAGDSLTYHAGSRFSAKDLDQDSWAEGNCAQSHGGGWWCKGCDTSNLNGKYLNGKVPESYLYQGMYWGEFRGAQYSLAKARMLIRPRINDPFAISKQL